jgi:mercuric ion binding protein
MWNKLLFSFIVLSATTVATAKEINIFVKEMNCQLCVYLVNKELRNVEGVQSTKADMKAQIVKVEAAENLDPQRLIKRLEDTLHYTAEIR